MLNTRFSSYHGKAAKLNRNLLPRSESLCSCSTMPLSILEDSACASANGVMAGVRDDLQVATLG